MRVCGPIKKNGWSTCLQVFDYELKSKGQKD